MSNQIIGETKKEISYGDDFTDFTLPRFPSSFKLTLEFVFKDDHVIPTTPNAFYMLTCADGYHNLKHFVVVRMKRFSGTGDPYQDTDGDNMVWRLITSFRPPDAKYSVRI